MTQVCKWIDRYGTKIKFVEVVEANNQMKLALESENQDEIDTKLQNFIDLYGKIEVVKSA